MGNRPWSEALERLSDCTGARCITLDAYDLDARRGEVLASNLAPHPAIDEYNQEIGRRNVLIETAYSVPRRRRVFRATDFMPIREFRRTALFNTVYKTLGLGFVAAVALETADSKVTQLSVVKPADARDFSDADLARLAALYPHLRQAWAGYQHVACLQRSLDTLTQLWDHYSDAVMVIDAGMRLRFANRAAEALLRAGRGWMTRNGALYAVGAGSQARLRKTVADLASARAQIHRIRSAGADDHDSRCGTMFRLDTGEIVLVMTDASRLKKGLLPGLQRGFDLTPAEAKLVHAIAQGQSLRDFADGHQISYDTARTHLKRAMSKNGWRRQGELIIEVLQEPLPAQLFERRSAPPGGSHARSN